MAAESYVLSMFTVNDRQEGYDRMVEALLETDSRLLQTECPPLEICPDASCKDAVCPESVGTESAACPESIEGIACPESIGIEGTANSESIGMEAIGLAEAWDGSREEVCLQDSAGRLAGEFVNLYPPGVPLLVPGERITSEMCQQICNWLRQGLTVQGVNFRNGKQFVKVLRNRD